MMDAEVKKELRQAMRRLKTEYARALHGGAGQADAVALCDNRDLLHAALSGAAVFLKKHPMLQAGSLWRACIACAAAVPAPDDAAISSFFEDRPLSLSQAASLAALLPAAYAAAGLAGFGNGAFSQTARALFLLREVDFEMLIPALCRAAGVLETDAAYALSDAETKAYVRKQAVRMSRAAGENEAALCTRLVCAEGGVFAALPPRADKRRGVAFLITEAVLPLLFGAALVGWFRGALEGFLRSPAAYVLFVAILYLPLLFALRPLLQAAAETVVKPYFLPSLDPENPALSLPPVLITVSSLLPPAEKAAAFADRLRKLRASHAGSPAAVLALVDPENAKTPSLPSDASDIAALRREIEMLNAAQGGGFLLAVRGRVYSRTENEYTGHERKRGAIEALVRRIIDGADGFDVLCGDVAFLDRTKYILALDADTGLPFGALKTLLCIARHPANRAVWDEKTRRVVSGYGCFAPRTEVSRAAVGTRFARVFTQGGVSAYAPRVSSRCMDLFGTGVFCGKGLIDVEIYGRVCCGVFPEGKVLSHDILEGSLLRTAFVSSAVFTEGFPASPASYYKRQNRWIRGDVQNLTFVFRPLARLQQLPGLAKYQLVDNVCRAAAPPACLFLLLSSVCVPFKAALPLFLAAVFGTVSGELLSALRILCGEGLFGFSRAFFSAGLSSGSRALLRVLLLTAFLPYEAAVCADAAVRGAVRICIGRRTLEWTTAAQAERRGRPAVFYPVLLPLLCAVLLSFGYPFHLVPAALFLLFAPFAVSDGRQLPQKKPRLTAGETASLRQYAAALWRYFEIYVGPQTHFLPPDNVQETPVRKVACRTSPTNIGLYLVCALAAADLALIPPAELSERLSESLDTVLSLRRYRGLLFNWYDTGTLEPLSPAFVSSVDCGNYLVCLTALREGLKEYLPLGLGFAGLIKRVDAELENARIEVLYVPRRRLFSVGLDPASGKLSDSFYDSYMSEARMTSFYAVARRLVPASHWSVPDRSFLRRGRVAAAASYGGTMFEYFMPSLFFPLYQNTYEAEALKSCLYWQKRRARVSGRPWGVSESGYYDFDEAVNYRYRAHGLRALALRRDPNDLPVFAPYAAFLALPVDPHGALKNLRRFAALGAYGTCGFYEAVDFSAEAMGEDYMIVRSFMAHHVGMSLLACANALRGGLFPKRFSRDPQMESALSLLEEKIPSDAPVRRRRRFAEQKKRPPDPRQPRRAVAPTDAALFSNGEVTLIVNDRGKNRVLYGSRALFRFSARAPGIAAAAVCGGQPLRFEKGRLLSTGWYAKAESPALTAESALALVDRFSSLAVPVKLKNRAKTSLTARIAYYFEPDLEPLFFASEHPAFSSMNVRIVYRERLSALVFSRMERGACAACVAVGFADLSPFAFSCDREAFPGADPLSALPAVLPSDPSFAFPCAAVRTELRLAPGAKKEKVLLVCPGPDEAAALQTLSRMRQTRLPDLRRAVRQVVPAEAQSSARRFLQTVFFGVRDPDISRNVQNNTAPAAALWEKGISGDVPVLRARADGIPLPLLRAFVKLHGTLLFCGIPADLVLLTEKPASYRGEALGALASVLPSGMNKRRVWVLSAEQCSPAFLSALSAAPGLEFPSSDAPLQYAAAEPEPLLSAPLVKGENGFVPGGYFIGKKPPRPWCHTLSNTAFGTLLTYGSLGFSWALNSRLNQLTPWQNDPSAAFSGETLLLETARGIYDVLSGASVYFRNDSAEYGAVCGDFRVRVTVQTDAAAMKKRVLVCAEGGAPCQIVYRVRPMLCDSEKRTPYLHSAAENGALQFSNPANTDYPGFLRLYADAPANAVCGAGEGRLSAALPRGGDVSFYMVYAAKEAALCALQALPFRPPCGKSVGVPHQDPAVRQFAEALLLHGVVDTRMLARTGFYQNSGAYGFRDQLQDAANVCAVYPQLAKTQLLRCAAAQFPEGDVLHWFHAVTAPGPHLKGVRTRCADDFLWLPWAAAEYVRRTGDADVLSLPVPYLSGEPLAEGERERYAGYSAGSLRESLYSHCLRAIRRALRFGPHALPLILGGDWNDSFSEVGLQGKGESVWLAMFLTVVCNRFAPLCRICADRENEAVLQRLADDLRLVTRAAAFNGRYFIRGFYDSGLPLGDTESGPCGIDLLPQAFAVFAEIGTKAERVSALKAAYAALFDAKYQTLRLFYPPFGEKTVRAGYVNDYPPGVRENAGQYTHAAVWFAMALQKEGLTAEAQSLLPALIPALRQKDRALWERFKNEPYAVTADIGMAPGTEGRGGWSGYTGAAGWIWRMLNDNAECGMQNSEL